MNKLKGSGSLEVPENQAKLFVNKEYSFDIQEHKVGQKFTLTFEAEGVLDANGDIDFDEVILINAKPIK